MSEDTSQTTPSNDCNALPPRKYPSSVEQHRRVPPKLRYLEEAVEDGMLVIRPTAPANRLNRTVLFVNDYGMALGWRLWKDGVYPSNHLWGCIELALLGYDVILPEPSKYSGLRRRLSNDWSPTLNAVRRLGPDDIVFCGHNVLLWTPVLKALRLARCKVVGLLFAREPLPLARHYDAIVAHTPVAAHAARANYPKVRTRHISWGMDLDFFTAQPYAPENMLSCGKTFRDFDVMAKAFDNSQVLATLIHPEPSALPPMPRSVEVVPGREIGEGIYAALAGSYYPRASATLLTIAPDPTNRHSIGLTNVLESMACARPVIATKTSAMVSEIDLVKEQVGHYVAPGDADDLRRVVSEVHEDTLAAAELGLAGRRLCESYFTIDRFAEELHDLFQTL